MDETSVADFSARVNITPMRRPTKPPVVKLPDTLSEIHPARVALRLIALREAVGLGPSEFADSVGIDRSSYTKIESGAKTLHQYMAYDIATRHGVTMEYLYRGRTEDGHLPVKYAQAIRAFLIGQPR
jgi:DNA-binding XRE family transcriptional regulator